jgi:hypothetical protein
LVAGASAPANARGYGELLRLAERHAPGRRAWAIEGTGSYGSGLCRYLHARGENVLEVSRISRGERRLRGKDDSLDAARTARAALSSETLALPRAGERREALRLLLIARRSAVDVRRGDTRTVRSPSPALGSDQPDLPGARPHFSILGVLGRLDNTLLAVVCGEHDSRSLPEARYP